MKILQVSEFFTPAMGGSAQVVYQVARHLAERGHAITVCASDYSRGGGSFDGLSFETRRFRSLPTRWKFYPTPGLVPWAARRVKSYDVVHLHNVRTFQNMVVAEAARAAGVPYVISPHGSLPYLGSLETFKVIYDGLYGRRLIAGASALIGVSREEVDQFQAREVPEQKINMIPNGLDLREFASLPPRGALRSRLSIGADTRVLLFLGRINRLKGLDFLLDGFEAYHRRAQNSVLVIAGPDDGYASTLKRTVKARGLEPFVRLVGPLYGPDRLAGFVDADLLIYPTRYEIFGLVPFEALLCGTPVIVTAGTAAGGLMVEAGVGGVVEFGSVESLMREIDLLFENPPLRQSRVEAGQRFVRENLDWARLVGRFEDLYGEVIRSARVARPRPGFLRI